MPPALHALLLISALLCLLGAPAAHAVTFNITYADNPNGPTPPDDINDSDGPISDPNGDVLLAMVNDAADMWSSIIRDDWTINIQVRWQAPSNPGNSALMNQFANHPDNLDEDGNPIESSEQNNRVVWASIIFSPNRKWWVDPTPFGNTEFDMAQSLYRDLPGSQQSAYTGSPPDLLEAGFMGEPSASAPPAMLFGDSASTQTRSRDLLSYALHELGHTLGVGGTTAAAAEYSGDGDYDIDPSLAGGATFAVASASTSDGHITNAGSTAPALMQTGNLCCRRRLPSAIDVLAATATANWTDLDLPRKEFLTATGSWHTDANWLGGAAPDLATPDDVFVRSGGTASITAAAGARSLLVTDQTDLSIQTGGNLTVFSEARVERGLGPTASAIVVDTGGTLAAPVFNVGDGGGLTMLGGTAQVAVNLNIEPGGQVLGTGTVEVNAALSNDGLIAGLLGGELTFDSDAPSPFDLDGNSGDGRVEAILGDVTFNAGLADPFGGIMTVGAGRTATMNAGWTLSSGGDVMLDGSGTETATLAGTVVSVLGSIDVQGQAAILAQPTFLAGSTVDVPAAAGHLTLANNSFFSGGQMTGSGTVSLDSPGFVNGAYTVDVATFDIDGASETTVLTINQGATLDIDSPNIDTDGVNIFHGTIHNNGGMLDVEPGWSLAGELNLTQTGGAGAALLGDGGLLILGFGQLNVTGFAGIGTETTIAGGVFAAGEANFNGDTSVLATADLETDGANDEIDFNGPTTLAGGSYTGSGVVKFDSQVRVVADTTIGMSQTDLDGDTGGAVIGVDPSVTFSVASSTIDPIDEAFDGEMNLQGTFSTIVPFQLEGVLNMTRSPGDPAPLLAGLTGFTISTSGTLVATGDAVIDRDTTVEGSLSVNAGVTQVNADTSFAPSAVVTVAAGSELELNGTTTLSGGSYTRGGLMQLNGTTVVDAPTTISTGRIDLDGEAESTLLTLGNAPLVLNVEGIDETNNLYSGTANVIGASARLEVNLVNSSAAWRLSPIGVLNFDSTGLVLGPIVMLEGNNLTAEGTINAQGLVALGVDVAVRGRLNSVTATSDVHFAGKGRSTIHQNLMATVAGLGDITVDNGSTVNLENGALVAVDTENLGRLEIGFFTSEVAPLDPREPGSATIRGNYAQGSRAELAVDLGGLVQGSQYDLLEVIGEARLNGTIEVALIDGFVPSVGDTFTVLTATNVVGQFDTVTTLDESGAYGFDVDVSYTNTDVILEILGLHLFGDLDCDGDIDFDDIDDFILGLNDPGSYEEKFGVPPSLKGDIDGDGDLDFDDIDDLVALLTGGASGLAEPAALQSVPEPATWLLMVTAMLAWAGTRRTVA